MTLEEKIDQLIKDVSDIKTLLGGYLGNPGLVKQVENNRKAITKIWLCLAFAAGGGGITAGLIKLLGG